MFFFWLSHLVGLPLFTNKMLSAISMFWVRNYWHGEQQGLRVAGYCFFVVAFVHNINMVVVKYIGLLLWLLVTTNYSILGCIILCNSCGLHHHHHPTAAAAEWTAAHYYYYCNYKEAWGNEHGTMMVKSVPPHWMMISDITLLIPNIINHMFDVIPNIKWLSPHICDIKFYKKTSRKGLWNVSHIFTKKVFFKRKASSNK